MLFPMKTLEHYLVLKQINIRLYIASGNTDLYITAYIRMKRCEQMRRHVQSNALKTLKKLCYITQF